MEFDSRPSTRPGGSEWSLTEVDAGLGRQRRHVLIPSELVTVEINAVDGGPQTLQADLINVSSGGCCLVLPRRLALAIGSQGVLLRPAEAGGALERRGFEVRWFQDLGDMIELGVQFIDG